WYTALQKLVNLSLHDALPIWSGDDGAIAVLGDAEIRVQGVHRLGRVADGHEDHGTRAVLGRGRALNRTHRLISRPVTDTLRDPRSEEHTSELQSRSDLVWRLL